MTGGSGFLGTRLRQRLQRHGLAFTELPRAAGADLLVPASYERALAGADAVVHLAAATGKAAPEEHFRVNVLGTEILLEHCRRLGVRRFVFASTIAVTFPDIRRYPYARAKLEAEGAVAASGLDFTIVRPTIIAGPGAPVLAGLAKLAGLPLVPVFGSGTARVQPILADDLADCVVTIVREGLCVRQTVELGGPEVITIEQLLAELHRVLRGRAMRAVHIPLPPVMAALGLLERVAYRFLPVTAGQLATFRFDGVAASNPVFEGHRARMAGIRRMVELSVAA